METHSYFVGYMLEGEAAAWHSEVAQAISHQFGTWKVHERVAPHLTIFYPFDSEDIQSISTFLEEWSNRELLGSMQMRDFGQFEDVAVFAKVEAPPTIDTVVKELQSELLKIAGIPRRGFRDWNPHATLAHRVPKETLKQIWEFVQTLPKPDFTLPFDNLTLFKHEGERAWSIEHIFRLS
jgi:2'-5' RNA ligase